MTVPWATRESHKQRGLDLLAVLDRLVCATHEDLDVVTFESGRNPGVVGKPETDRLANCLLQSRGDYLGFDELLRVTVIVYLKLAVRPFQIIVGFLDLPEGPADLRPVPRECIEFEMAVRATERDGDRVAIGLGGGNLECRQPGSDRIQVRLA